MGPSLCYRFALVTWASLLMSGTLPASAPEPSSRLDVEARAEQPAGVAVLLRLTFNNTGKEPFSYWLGLGQSYISADCFAVQVTDAQGREHKVTASNTWIHSGSGSNKVVQPGQSIKAPAALPPLPPGTYTIRPKGIPGHAAKVTVRDDPPLLAARAQEIVEGVRKGEDLAAYVAATFPHPSTTRLLLHDLLSERERQAERAEFVLWRLQELPREAGDIILKALRQQMSPARQRKTAGVSYYLINLTARIGSEEALDALLGVVHSDMHFLTRAQAARHLCLFKQKRAQRELRGLLEDESDEVREEARKALQQLQTRRK